MMNHTPEPWEVSSLEIVYNALGHSLGTGYRIVFGGDDHRWHVATVFGQLDEDAPLKSRRGYAQANAVRIVQCVNGCVGMEDPPMDILRLSDVAAEADTLSQALIELLRDYARNDAWARDLLRQTINLGTNARRAFAAVNK